MFQISQSTDLFEDIPQKDIMVDELEEYKNIISSTWHIEPDIPETPEIIESEPVKPQKISTEAPKKPIEILKGSVGSRIFSMLQKTAPSTRTVVSVPEGKSSDVSFPARKLRFS